MANRLEKQQTTKSTHERDIFISKDIFEPSSGTSLTSEPQLQSFISWALPSHQNRPTNWHLPHNPHPPPPHPMCEAAISSFLFNPLLLICAFPPCVSMAMLSALHQELRPGVFTCEPVLAVSSRALSSVRDLISHNCFSSHL